MGQDHGGQLSDDDDIDTDDDDNDKTGDGEVTKKNTRENDSESDNDEEEDGKDGTNFKSRFEELLGKYHTNILLESEAPLDKTVAEEVFRHFLQKNNLTDSVTQGRLEFLTHLRTWDNSVEKSQRLLTTCFNFIRVQQETARRTITVDTFKEIFRRTKGGVGPAFKLTKQRIIENLQKDVGIKLYREQASKVDQIFRESMQRDTDNNGEVVFSINIKGQ